MTIIIEVTIDAANACDNFRFHCIRIGPIKKARIELRKIVRISMEIIIIIIILMTESTYTVPSRLPIPPGRGDSGFLCEFTRDVVSGVCVLDFFFLFQIGRAGVSWNNITIVLRRHRSLKQYTSPVRKRINTQSSVCDVYRTNINNVKTNKRIAIQSLTRGTLRKRCPSDSLFAHAHKLWYPIRNF